MPIYSAKSTPGPLYKLRKSPKLMRSLRLLQLGQSRSFRTTHTTANTHANEHNI